MKLTPIGTVQKRADEVVLELDARYAPGLLGLEGFSHVHVLWWFARRDTPEDRAILQVHPRGDADNPLTGVFATRAPVRPNLVALTTCAILRVAGRRVWVDAIDAEDGTPIVDLKPYIPRSDRPAEPTVPAWVGRGRDGGS